MALSINQLPNFFFCYFIPNLPKIDIVL